jgi:flagellar secretion chaperone FliS
MNRSEFAYRKAAAESASGLALLTALFDTLAGDIRRAVEAERYNDIDGRCRELNHAILVIGYLEDRINKGSGGELSAQLIKFYIALRRELIVAQARRSPEMLEQQLNMVLGVRSTWQELESHFVAIPATVPTEGYAEGVEKVPSNWLA